MSTKSAQATVQPYLCFNGRCEEAVNFYQKALGAEVEILMRFKDSPEPPDPNYAPANPDAVMHTSFRIGNTVIMASDGCEAGEAAFKGFSLSIAPATEAEADRIFNALADCGQVQMPLAKTFWSPRFGMVTDRFGLSWMVNVVPPQA